jgi:hypothetical protein
VTTSRFKPQAPAATEERGDLAASVLDARPYRPVVVPRTSVKGDMRLLSRGEIESVRADCREHMRNLGIEGPGIEGFPDWREAFNLRLVATALRQPADRARPLGNLEEWKECDDEQILALYDTYQDMAAELDPLGHRVELDEEDLRGLRAAAKKGDVPTLVSYGSQKLARMVALLAGTAEALPS